MKRQHFLILALLPFFFSCSGPQSGAEKSKDSSVTVNSSSPFVQVKGTHFELDGKPYYYLGTNFWEGMNLASKGPGGDRERLLRELDKMKALGITNLRILAGSEGPDTEPWRIVPSMQPSPGVYNKDLLDGLDFLLSEMGKRKMLAIVVLNDFWQWSGGMAQYLQWNGGGNIPYPPPHPGGSWDVVQKYTAQFYSNKNAVKQANDFVRMIVTRKNTYSGLDYKNDPAIMAWQLGNEPRGAGNTTDFNVWIDSTSALIKSLDPNHLVSTGCEGETPSPEGAGVDFVKNHSSKNIDYATVHIWVQNWGWYDPAKSSKTFEEAKSKMMMYFNDHVQKSIKMGKPMVVEEFGLARDKGSFDPAATTAMKDQYYSSVFDQVYIAAKSGSPVAGVNFWAWAGEGRPKKPYGGYWKAGDPFLGDPPHEQQGWYSVYDSDSTTTGIIRNYTAKMSELK
ncbi:MAG: cellulase family glycosylhydrolase [Cytophagaceae bacterium]